MSRLFPLCFSDILQKYPHFQPVPEEPTPEVEEVKINSLLMWLFGLITNSEMTEKMLFQPIVEEPRLEAPTEVP